ncbi:hypothetical protein H5410_032182 [Solanum commersonii]|uniref:Uncharacterized protein n=1 Tax=Solanum commersonii TaxID=4109 RepID=A0A9J5YNX2_SOLCO|nr:hypothetical protein H5410_032182 [Solanum commersonii]
MSGAAFFIWFQVLILGRVVCGGIVWVVMLLELDFDEINASICTGYKFLEFSFPWRKSVLHVSLLLSLLVVRASNLPVLSLKKGGGEVFKGYCFSCALKAVGEFLLWLLGGCPLFSTSVVCGWFCSAFMLLELDLDEINGSICIRYKFWEFSFPWRHSVLHVTSLPSSLVIHVHSHGILSALFLCATLVTLPVKSANPKPGKRRRASINGEEASNLPVLSLKKGGGEVFKGYCFSCALKAVGEILLLAFGRVSVILNKMVESLDFVLPLLISIKNARILYTFRAVAVAFTYCQVLSFPSSCFIDRVRVPSCFLHLVPDFQVLNLGSLVCGWYCLGCYFVRIGRKYLHWVQVLGIFLSMEKISFAR